MQVPLLHRVSPLLITAGQKKNFYRNACLKETFTVIYHKTYFPIGIVQPASLYKNSFWDSLNLPFFIIVTHFLDSWEGVDFLTNSVYTLKMPRSFSLTDRRNIFENLWIAYLSRMFFMCGYIKFSFCLCDRYFYNSKFNFFSANCGSKSSFKRIFFKLLVFK